MRAWQKLILATLFVTATAALGGAGTLIYFEQAGRAAVPESTAIAQVEPSPTAATATGAVIVVRGGSLTATPFQPLPITSTPSPTPTPLPTSTGTATSTTESTREIEAVSTPSAPEEVYLTGIWGYRQTYNLSCESRSASDLARYFGVYFTELEFFYALPPSDNPDTGFVGDVHGFLGQLPPLGYGVHAAPVAKLMRTFGLDATAHKGLSLKTVREELRAGRPVMVWAIKDLGTSTPVEYEAADGDITIVARFEHTVIVIGFGPGYITVLDNERVYSVPTEQFLNSWGVLGNMAITVSDS